MKHFLAWLAVVVFFIVGISYADNRYFLVQAPLDTVKFADCSDAEFVEGKVDKVSDKLDEFARSYLTIREADRRDAEQERRLDKLEARRAEKEGRGRVSWFRKDVAADLP